MTTPTPTYLDTSLPFSARVQSLVAQMTLEEKIGQLQNNTQGVPRLGIPAYNYWNEALHGVARNGRATIFPQAIGMAATWDPPLIQRVASAIGDEARAKHHEAIRRNGFSRLYQGLNFWSPNVNIYRDPRWGRGQETWGEDPYLTGRMGAAFVRGMQGDDPRYLKTAACAKHYAVHSGPEKHRHGFDARVSLRDMHETYLPAFKALVEAGVESVMGAYNRTNGEPCCAHPYLIGEVLRGQWGFEGHFLSDCGAIDDIYMGHGSAPDAASAAALALTRGCDLECGGTYKHLGEALERGLVSMNDIDRALSRVLTTRFKLGMFDPPEQVPYASTPLSVIGSEEHRALAYEAAVKSVVLLKNRNNILPLGHEVRTMRVLGPTAADASVLLGSYHGLNGTLTTLLEGIVARMPEGLAMEYRQGVQLIHPNTATQEWLFIPRSQPDVVIACMGVTPMLEGEEGDSIASTEEGDRAGINLPQVQAEFVRKLANAGAKVVLVLTGGGPIALGDLEELVEAVVFAWYPGEAGGLAVADILFGHVTPSGKLPLTFPRSLDDLPPFDDYSMQGRTYRYAAKEPLYPFGFGLSYTQFAYGDLRLEREQVAAGEDLPFSVTLSNIGTVDGEEVVQVYVSALDQPGAPSSSLVAFQRVPLRAGERKILALKVPSERLTLVDEAGVARVVPGRMRVTVGGCSPGSRGVVLGAPEPVSAEFMVL
ncbi:MAG: glycoside hydrolase family 3 C-terminal domain-containing protein [Chloroflexota bacterium]|nr:glycoside hydrolase family 3 C-terminal domain-containing protein [Chloroflexota bacterium]MDQ5866738.1 glycoside hydrolase family 3 C-terminal domain-containing protein [Chloroflexota bacterium]